MAYEPQLDAIQQLLAKIEKLLFQLVDHIVKRDAKKH